MLQQSGEYFASKFMSFSFGTDFALKFGVEDQKKGPYRKILGYFITIFWFVLRAQAVIWGHSAQMPCRRWILLSGHGSRLAGRMFYLGGTSNGLGGMAPNFPRGAGPE